MPALFGGGVWLAYPYLLPCLASLMLAPLSMFTLHLVPETAGPWAKRKPSQTLPSPTPTSTSTSTSSSTPSFIPTSTPTPSSGSTPAVTPTPATTCTSASAAGEDGEGSHGFEDLGVCGGGAAAPEDGVQLAVGVDSSTGAAGVAPAQRTGAEADDAALLRTPRHEWCCRCYTLRSSRLAQTCRPRCQSSCRECWSQGVLCSKFMILSYCSALLGFVVVGMQELFPLFSANAVHGLGLAPSQLGVAIAPMGITLMTWPLVVPALILRFSAITIFRFGICMFLVINLAIPSLPLLTDLGGEAALWSGLVVFALLRSIAGTSSFITGSIILNSLLADGGDVGFYNGVADSLSALGRAIAPTATGALFAAMTQSDDAVYPFDEHFPFYFVSSTCVFVLILSTKLGDSGKAHPK